MYTVEYTGQFKKDLKRCFKRGLNMTLIHCVIKQLEMTGTLPSEYKPHILSGKYSGLWECHITSDWLLVWYQDNSSLRLLMTNTGTHSDLF